MPKLLVPKGRVELPRPQGQRFLSAESRHLRHALPSTFAIKTLFPVRDHSNRFMTFRAWLVYPLVYFCLFVRLVCVEVGLVLVV